MHELPDANRPRVAVAAHANRNELLIREHRAGADRWHAAVDGVETVRAAEEIRRALAGAADARQLHDLLGVDTHLVKRVDDALGNRVVSAAGAQRRLAALIGLRFEPDTVNLDWSRHYSPPVIEEAEAGVSFLATSKPSCARMSSLTLRASIGNPL